MGAVRVKITDTREGYHGVSEGDVKRWFEAARLGFPVDAPEYFKVEMEVLPYIVLALESVCVRVMSDVWENQMTAVVFNTVDSTFHRHFTCSPYINYNYSSRTVEESQKYGWVYFCSQDNHHPEFSAIIQIKCQSDDARLQACNAASAIRYARTNLEEAKSPRNGSRVQVNRGRKVPQGTTGLVFWTGQDSYGKAKLGISPSGVKVGNKYTDAVWTAASNCDVIENEMELQALQTKIDENEAVFAEATSRSHGIEDLYRRYD